VFCVDLHCRNMLRCVMCCNALEADGWVSCICSLCCIFCRDTPPAAEKTLPEKPRGNGTMWALFPGGFSVRYFSLESVNVKVSAANKCARARETGRASERVV